MVFSEPGLVSGSNSVYELEVMSPWDQQRIEFSAHEWKQVVELSSDRVGEWQMIELSIPQAILPLKQLHVRTYKLRAPDILGPSSDKRRLGVALRYSATRQ